MTELEEAQVMDSDGTDAIRFGFAEVGGYGRHTKLNADQGRHMCTQEPGNCWQQM